jgi:hypothetical protein
MPNQMVRTMIKRLPTYCLMLLFPSCLWGQLYLETGAGTAELDLCNCASGPVFDPVATQAIATDPAGNLYYLFPQAAFRLDAATGVTTQITPLPPFLTAITLVYAPNGLLYTIGYDAAVNENVLFSINPVTGQVINLGNLAQPYSMQGDLFFFNGQMYALADDPTGVTHILQVPLNNPGAATPVYSYTNWTGNVGAATVVYNGVLTVLVLGIEQATGQPGLYTLDMNTGAYELICPGLYGGDLAAPPGYVVPPCCENEAGNWVESGLQTYCTGEQAVLTHNNQESLGAGASLSYVLVSDTSLVLPAGIIQMSASPNFTFTTPAMSVNTVYYAAPVAAPGVQGAPQWNAGCVDVGFFVPVVWRPRPAVSFTLASGNVCAGACVQVNASFTGTPPFELVYNAGAAGSGSIQSNTNSANFVLCIPPGFPAGPLQVQALSATDAYCECQ